MKVQEKEDFGKKNLFVTLHLAVVDGEVYDATEATSYGARNGGKISLKKALKIARILGVEEVVRKSLKDQGLALAEQARSEREKANDEHHRRMKSAGDKDAQATRLLTRLSSVDD